MPKANGVLHGNPYAARGWRYDTRMKTWLIMPMTLVLGIPAQWYAFAILGRYVFPHLDRGLFLSPTRRLTLLAAINLVLLFIIFSPWKPHGGDITWSRMVAIAYFSYLGAVALILVFFGTLKLLARGITRDDGSEASGNRLSGGSKDNAGHPTALQEHPGSDMPHGVPGGLQSKPRLGTRVSRRSFLKWGTVAGVGAAVGIARSGLVEAYEAPMVEHFTVTHPSLHGLSRPLTFIQASDFHYGWFFGLPQLEGIVEALNQLDGDAVVLTGDIFHSRRTDVQSSEPVLRRLRKRRFGNFVVLGNHELYTGKARSIASFTRSGLIHLDSAWTSLPAGDTTIHLGGLSDPLTEWSRVPTSFLFRRLMDRVPQSPGMRLLLCHRPSILSLAAVGEMDLVLTGHTHGGQMILPLPGARKGFSPAQCFTRYPHGWYRKFDCRMYVNRGAGLIYVPWRINCPPEITLFHLSAPPPEYRGRVARVARS